MLINVASILCDTYTGSTYLLDDVGHSFLFFLPYFVNNSELLLDRVESIERNLDWRTGWGGISHVAVALTFLSCIATTAACPVRTTLLYHCPKRNN